MSEPPVGPAAPSVTEVETGDAVCLHSPTTQEVLMLNQTASDVWFLCDGTRTASQIVTRLAEVYAEDADTIAGEVHEAIGQFRAAGLLASNEA